FLVPDRAQQGITLRQDARQVSQIAGGPAVALTYDRVQEAASLRRRADQQEHLLRAEQDAAHGLAQTADPSCQAVDRHPLANLPRGIRAGDERLDPHLGPTLIDELQSNPS